MKTKEELSALKEAVETINKKLVELTDEELVQVTGGEDFIFIGRHSIREPLIGGINIDLNGHNYYHKQTSMTMDPPDMECEKR